jgi:hypothetical protein
MNKITADHWSRSVKQAYPDFTAARVRLGTFNAAVTFFVILCLTRRLGWKIAVSSAPRPRR